MGPVGPGTELAAPVEPVGPVGPVAPCGPLAPFRFIVQDVYVPEPAIDVMLATSAPVPALYEVTKPAM